MAALQAALALTEVEHHAVGVGQHLDLDVPGAQHESLQEQGVVAECGGRLPSRRTQSGGQISGIIDAMHALPAAAGRGLHQQRIADAGGGGNQISVGQSAFGDAGDHWNPKSGHRGLGGDLVAHRGDGRGRRTDEYQSGTRQCGGEIGVLRKESVAGVHRLRPGTQGGVDHGLDVEVALPGRWRADPYRNIGLCDVPGGRVGVAVDRHRTDTHGSQRADDAHRDLAAVCDEHGVEHCQGHCPHIRKTP